MHPVGSLVHLLCAARPIVLLDSWREMLPLVDEGTFGLVIEVEHYWGDIWYKVLFPNVGAGWVQSVGLSPVQNHPSM